uniref:Uncharacterized protein n=1 Tax=Cucumis melo TaxID=3656 RepID=A0A9I9EF28_CUCME
MPSHQALARALLWKESRKKTASPLSCTLDSKTHTKPHSQGQPINLLTTLIIPTTTRYRRVYVALYIKHPT